MLLSTSETTPGYKCKCDVILAVIKGKAVSKICLIHKWLRL